MKSHAYLIFAFIYLTLEVCFAQPTYKAYYDQKVQNIDTNIKNMSPDMILKIITDKSYLLAYCSKDFNKISEVSGINNKEIKVNKYNRLKAIQSGSAYRIISYNKNKEIFFEEYNNAKHVLCTDIDYTKLNFAATSEVKKINKWICTKYVSADTSNRDIIMWLSSEIPNYINPGIYLPNIEAGVISIQFINKGELVLKSFEQTKVNPSLPNNYRCTDTLNEPYNILNHEIRSY